MSRAALRSTLVITGVTGILGAGLLQAAVAGATEPWQSSADGTTTTYRSVDTGTELPFLVPAGVTSLDVTVLGGEQGAQDAAPATQQLVVPPGSTLVFDLGHDDELTRPVPAAPGDSGEPPLTGREAPEETAPAPWYIVSGTGAAASIRVADRAEPVAEDGAAAPAEDLRGRTPEEPVEVPAVLAGQDGGAAAQDEPEDAPVSVVVSFTVPTPGVVPVELQAAGWLAPAGEPADEPVLPAEVADLAEDPVPVEPSVPSGSPTPADDVRAPMGTAVDGTTPDPAEAPVDAPAAVEVPVATEAPAAGEAPAPAPEDVPAPVQTPVLTEAPAVGEAPAPVETPEASAAPAPAEGPAPAEAPADTTTAAEPAAAVVTEAPAPAEAPGGVALPQSTAPATSSSPEPTSAPRGDVPTPAASPSAGAVDPSAAPQPADERLAVDLQTASSVATADLLDADGVGILAASLVGVVVLGVGVTVTVGVRRRD